MFVQTLTAGGGPAVQGLCKLVYAQFDCHKGDTWSVKELFDVLRKKVYLHHMFYIYTEQTKMNRHISPNVKLFLQCFFSPVLMSVKLKQV